MKYNAVAWLQDDSDFTIDDGVQRLRKRFSDAEISSANDVISIEFGIFSAKVYLESEPRVAIEAKEFAGLVPDYRRVSELAQCHRRISVICNEAETMMEYFNDFLFIGETLQEFSGVMLFDLAGFPPFGF